MSEVEAIEGVGRLLRKEPDAFDALRDQAAARNEIDPGAIEKDYWATEVLRSAVSGFENLELCIFKGGTSLSKAFRLIERLSEDIDLLVPSEISGNVLKRGLREIADRVATDVGHDYEREVEGRGYLNARFPYNPRREAAFLSRGVLLEIGTRGGPLPNEICSVASLMSDEARELDPAALTDFQDLAPFDVSVLVPERTMAEKLAFLHHRATVRDYEALTKGARHLYDVAMLVESDRVLSGLRDNPIETLMHDIDARSESAGWTFTPRPDKGFATSLCFAGDEDITRALRGGYQNLDQLVWGRLPPFDEAIAAIHAAAEVV